MAKDLAALKEFLPKTPFFGGLDDAQLDRIIAMLVERSFQKGSTVFREGDSGRSMYIIHSGTLLLSKGGGLGNNVKLVRLGVGDFFGETTLIEMQPRPSTVTVEEDAVLYELTNVDLYTLYRTDVKGYVMVLQNINRELCRRLRRSDNRITEIADEAGDESTQIRPARTRERSRPPKA
jgi:CRP/FNR family transcriptional regulator, cyclic AMP receptor protein